MSYNFVTLDHSEVTGRRETMGQFKRHFEGTAEVTASAAAVTWICAIRQELAWFLQGVSQASLGMDKLWAAGVSFNLFSQSPDINPYSIGAIWVVSTPQKILAQM